MNGFHHYFLSQLVDTNPHIVISDEIRQAAPQPLTTLHPEGAVEVRRVLPRDPVRGIAGAAAILDALNAMDGVAAAPSLIGQAILRHAGRDYSVTAIGVDAPREARVTDIVHDMVEGSFDDARVEPERPRHRPPLAEKMGVGSATASPRSTTAGAQTSLKIVGLFHTGIDAEDQYWAITGLARQQAMQATAAGGQSDPRPSRRRLALDPTRGGDRASLGLQERALGGDLRPRARRLRAAGQDHVPDHRLDPGRGRLRHLQRHLDYRDGEGARHRHHALDRHAAGLDGRDLPDRGDRRRRDRHGARLARRLGPERPHPHGPRADRPCRRPDAGQADASLFASASVIALLSAVAAAWLPARKAARADPLTIIRGAA